MEKKFVTFRVGNERYGIAIESVERILPVQEVTKVPKAPKAVLGIFELRGDTIAAIDARTRFEITTVGPANNFVVVIDSGQRFAIQVDSVEGILEFADDEIDEPTSLFANQTDAMISGIGKKESVLTVLLDPATLVPEKFRTKVSAAA